MHASCEGISEDQCKQLVSFTSIIENIAYLCKLNSCQSRFKQLIQNCVGVTDKHDDLNSRLEEVEAKLDRIVQEVGSKLENHSKSIESIPSSASAVEVKLNKVVQEFGGL